MANSYHHIYLSPHYDDASLSCGGAIHQQSQAGQPVLVITICAASPPKHEPLSPFAQKQHHAWGNPADMVMSRQAEDRASMAILGAAHLWLPFTDCIYRGQPQQTSWYYNDNSEIFGTIHPDELSLSQEIGAALLERIGPGADTTIYAPLGVGHHVDHQLAYTAAWLLRQQGRTIAFYEDYPYADPNFQVAIEGWHEYSLAATLAAQQPTAKLHPHVRFLSEENLQAKIESVRAYTSQLKTLFGSETAVENYLRRYAWHVGQGKPAERIWLPG